MVPGPAVSALTENLFKKLEDLPPNLLIQNSRSGV